MKAHDQKSIIFKKLESFLFLSRSSQIMLENREKFMASHKKAQIIFTAISRVDFIYPPA